MRRLVGLTPALLISAVLVAQVGCKKKEEEAAAKPEGGGAAPAEKVAGPAAVAPDAEKPVAVGLDALAYLPKDTLFFIAGDGVAPMAERLGREKLMEKYSEQLKPIIEAVTAATGTNLLDPANLKEVGFDPAAPVGFGYGLLADEPVGVVFASLTDAEKAKGLLTKVAETQKVELTEETHEGATLLFAKDEDEGVAVLKDQTFLLVIADREGPKAAKALLALSKADSLAGSEAFAAQMKALGFGKHVAGCVDVQRLFATVLTPGKVDVGVKVEEPKDARDPADDAEAEAMAAERVKAREAAQKAEREWEARMEAENKKIQETMTKVTGGKALATFGLSFRGDAILARALYAFGEGSPLSKVVKAPDGTPAVVRALDEAPLYLASANLDLEVISQLVRDFAAMEGEADDYEQGVKMVRGLTGIDLGDLGKTFTGEVALAITGDVAGAGRAALPSKLGGVLLLGLTDEEALKKTVDRLMDTFGDKVRDQVTRGEDGSLTIKTPWKTVHVRIGGGYLAATDDAAVFERLKGKGAGFAAQLKPDGLPQVLTGGKPAAIGFIDIGALAQLGASFWADAESSAVRRELPEAESEEKKAKLKELEEARTKVEKLRTEADAERDKFMKDFFAALGVAGGRMDIADGGFVAYGGIYLKDKTLAELVASGVEFGVNQEMGDSANARYRKARSDMWRIEDQLYQMK